MAEDIMPSVQIVRQMCDGGNGVFHDACIHLCDEIERLRAVITTVDAVLDDYSDPVPPASANRYVDGWHDAIYAVHHALHSEEARRG